MKQKKETPFRVLHMFLKNIGSKPSMSDPKKNVKFTLQGIAEQVDVSVETVNKWSAGTQPIRNVNNLFNLLFVDTQICPEDFLIYLKNHGYNISDKLFESINKDNSRFITFLSEFLNGNIRNPIIKSYTAKKHTKDKEYFPQKLYSKKNNTETFNISMPNFSYFESNNRILVEAPGGQGKSEFLRQLELISKKSKKFDCVIRFELTDLLLINGDDALNNINSQKTDNKHNTILLLLDGLNELYASTDIQRLSKILSEINYISKSWNNICIVITSRSSNGMSDYNETVRSLYEICYLSGVPKDKYDEFIEKNSFLDDAIKDLAKIPLYFNVLSTLKDTSTLKSKYDAIFEVYKGRCKQNKFDENTFFAFYILSPFIAQKISRKTVNTITETEIDKIISSMQKVYPNKLIDVAKKECKNSISFPRADMNKVKNILFNHGPLVRSENGYKFFHDEVRDFLCCFATIISIKAFKDFSQDYSLYNKVLYDEIFSIDASFNLKDESSKLLKSYFQLTDSTGISKSVSNLYDFDENILITPELILYAHTAFSMSDYLNLGDSILEPVHNSLLNFTNSVFAYLDEGILENVFIALSHKQEVRCKKCLSDIISKHCEFFRTNCEYHKCLTYSSYAEKINPNSDEINNQKAKCLIAIHRDYILNHKSFNIKDFGFSDFSELFKEGYRLLERTANNDFNLSVNLYTMLQSVPAPYLFDDRNIYVNFDYVSAFMRNYNMIFTNKHDDYTLKEIAYTVRQSVGLLIKGYVKVSPEINYIQGRPLGPNTIVLGDKDTLNLNSQTIELAKYLLSFVDDMTMNTLNYYRGVVAYYNRDYKKAEAYFNTEKDIFLKTLFLKHWKNTDEDVSYLYEEIKNKFCSERLDAADKCHPLYWYIDLKNLEISFSNNNLHFFEEFEKELPETWKNIVKLLTQ